MMVLFIGLKQVDLNSFNIWQINQINVFRYQIMSMQHKSQSKPNSGSYWNSDWYKFKVQHVNVHNLETLATVT